MIGIGFQGMLCCNKKAQYGDAISNYSYSYVTPPNKNLILKPGGPQSITYKITPKLKKSSTSIRAGSVRGAKLASKTSKTKPKP